MTQPESERPVCFGTITQSDACFLLPRCIYKIKCKERAASTKPTKVSDCTDFFKLADGTRVCTIRPHDSPHMLCENLVKFGMCPKGLK